MKKAKLFMMLALLVMGVSNLFAQNVTVHPGNGHMLATLKTGGGDTFYNWGGFATWKHEQLALTVTTGDSDNNLSGRYGTENPLTASGQLQNPANDIFMSDDKKCLQIGKGSGEGMDTYITIGLPNGYRFTGYRIKFHRIDRPDGEKVDSDVNEYTGSISFGETNNSLNYTNNYPSERNIGQNYTKSYTLERNGNDMSNVLYFRLSNNKQQGRAFIQLDEIELYFTAENNYTPMIAPPNTNNKSAVNIPFLTSKIDYGTLESNSDGGDPRYSYRGNISDLNANLILYEDTSVTEDMNNGYDGTVGKMVAYKEGSISSMGTTSFKLDGNNYVNRYNKVHGDTAIYFIESPIWATKNNNASAHKFPIGYRITGASFDCTPGTGTAYIPATFYIRYTDGGVTYGLNNYNTRYNQYNQSVWSIDQDGYIYSTISGIWGSYSVYLSVGNDGVISYVDDKDDASTFEIVENNGIKQILVEGTTDQYVGWEEYTTGGWWPTTYWRPVITNADGHKSFYDEVSPAQEATTGEYTFLIYDKTGTKVEKKEVISGTNKTVSIDGLNNDAVKIGVIGTGIISGHITMQALDPYVDHLDIVCQEKNGNGGRLTQQFNATDFSVRGGKFTFYAPTDFKGDYKFSFEKLYSLYGDSTYYENSASKNHARYSFVWSPYHQWIGSHGKNVYNTNPDHVYTDKIHTDKPGKVKFTFNNAEDVDMNGGEFKEFPFNAGLYGETNFDDFIFTEDDVNNKAEKTAYLFTCDETRYNIAPTTGTQHTFYAYYEMTIDMQLKNYDPFLTWEKLYDKTFYADENGKINRDSKWGLTVTTTQTMDDNGTHSGYLTVSQIVNAINNRTKDNTVAGGPKTSDQILYIDAHDLMSIVENQTPSTTVDGDNETVTYTSHPLNELMTKPDQEKGLDKNALIYLPYGSSANYDNFAFNTIAKYDQDPNFRGANNIVITDRYPFFSKYDIQVDAAKLLKYDRLLTPAEGYSNVVNATVLLPFTIGVTKGVHDPAAADPTLTSASPFTISTMNADAALSKAKGFDYGTENTEHVGYFTAIDGDKSVANVPYVVTVDGAQSGDYNFYVRQAGAKVVATPATVNDNSTTNGIFTGTASNGSVDGTDYTLTPTGTYMGKEVTNAKSASPAVFYFSKDCFVTTRTLGEGKSLKILPFRSFYEYPAKANAKMTSFRIVFGENEDLGGATGIKDAVRDADLAVIPGAGSITLMARADKNVTIHRVNGVTVDRCNLRAGESRTVAVPAGIYVINGTKMVVK